MSKSTEVKRLREENEDLKNKIVEFTEKVDSLSQNIKSMEKMNGVNGRSVDQEEPLSSELKKSVEFLSNQYDNVMKELDQIKVQIKEISKKSTEYHSTAIDVIEDYSFNYNVKIVGMPVFSDHERADETVEIWLRLFKALGVKDITHYDIDIAHRVPTRSSSNKPNPIICKFTRRITKEKVMTVRKNVLKISPNKIGCREQSSLEGLHLYDHLSPRLQTLLREAKLYKEVNNYKFC